MQHLGVVDIYYTGMHMNAEVGREEKALSTVVPTVCQTSQHIYIYFQAGASPQVNLLFLYCDQVQINPVLCIDKSG